MAPFVRFKFDVHFHNITGTKWLECELPQTATFQDLIGHIHRICEDSDIPLRCL